MMRVSAAVAIFFVCSSWAKGSKEVIPNTLINEAGSFKSRDEFTTITVNDSHGTSEPSGSSAPLGKVNCESQQETTLEDIERQEQEARDAEKGVVGLEIAQGAIEITLGAIRIAAAGTTADVLRREDTLAGSRAALGIVPPVPEEILGPIAADYAPKKVCGRRTTDQISASLHNSYYNWTQEFSSRMKRFSTFSNDIPFMQSVSQSTTPKLKSPFSAMNVPNFEEAEQLLSLLENVLDTNNQILDLLGVELRPLTASAALIMQQYKKRLNVMKQTELGRSNGLAMGDGDGLESDGSSMNTGSTIKILTSELARLTRVRRMYKVQRR